MLLAIALLAVVAGGLLMILGDGHQAGRLVAAGVLLAFAAPLVDQAVIALGGMAHHYGGALALIVFVVLLIAGLLRAKQHGAKHEASTSLKRRVDHDH